MNQNCLLWGWSKAVDPLTWPKSGLLNLGIGSGKIWDCGGFERFGSQEAFAQVVGNENSARSFSDRSSFQPPWGHGRPRLRVVDVRTEMLVFFPGFQGHDRSVRRDIRVDVRGISGPKTYSLGCFLFLK